MQHTISTFFVLYLSIDRNARPASAVRRVRHDTFPGQSGDSSARRLDSDGTTASRELTLTGKYSRLPRIALLLYSRI